MVFVTTVVAGSRPGPSGHPCVAPGSPGQCVLLLGSCYGPGGPSLSSASSSPPPWLCCPFSTTPNLHVRIPSTSSPAARRQAP